jgi:hypothetical protein
MKPEKSQASLRYMVTTLRQIATVLRDFELGETAALLDVATRDLEDKILTEAEAKQDVH